MLNKKNDILHCRISSNDKLFLFKMAKDNNMSVADFIIFKTIYSDEKMLLKYKDFILNQMEQN